MIKEFFINLNRCTKKKVDMENKFPNAFRIVAADGTTETPESISPFRVKASWKDPFSGRKTTQGEVGCCLSHIKAWKICTILEEPIIVLEDDVEILDPLYQEKVSKYSSDYDFIYLGYKDMEGECSSINEDLKLPKFTYWACSYYITPKVAQTLLDYYLSNELIPVDEAIPAVLNINSNKSLNVNCNFKFASFKTPLMKPFEGAFDISETEKSPLWKDFNLHIVSCGTDESKMEKNIKDIDHNIGKGITWNGGIMEKGPGGGQKINLMKSYLNNLKDNDIVMFIDGYDTFIVADREEITDRYLGFNADIVFSAEKICWPDASLGKLHPESSTEFKYLNSGTYIGTVKALKDFFKEEIKDHEDDQLYCQKALIQGTHNVVLDTESYIFACLGGAEKDIIKKDNYIINTATNCTTCVVHGNGGANTKEFFDYLYHTWKGIKPAPLGTDILKLSSLLSKEWCDRLIKACEEQGSWRELPGDKVPGQEIRLNTLKDQSFKQDFYTLYNEIITSSLESYWPKLKMYGIRDLFVIKYTTAQQASLPLHHDMSLISGAIKLNEGYEGGLLNFPRQNTDNSSLNVGDGVFWPAQVTHPHESLGLKSGTKYSLVLWTGRYKEEGEYYEKVV